MALLGKVFKKALTYGTGAAAVACTGVGACIYASSMDPPSYKVEDPINSVLSESNPVSANYWKPPGRESVIKRLKESGSSSSGGQPFDLIVVGGGATGSGCALDATTRGLNVALVEANDFASGTSSKSTKLVHGGVRYLEKAFWNLDYEQFKLVNAALKERGIFLKLAPYLAYELPLMIPAYSWWQAPYYYMGTLAYALIAKFHGDALKSCGYLSKAGILAEMPFLSSNNLIGAIVYSDGAHNDSRMNTLVALTAAAHGAAVANYVEVVGLLKKPRKINIGKFGLGKNEIYGVIARDKSTGEEFEIHAKGVISATGPLSDNLRVMDLGKDIKNTVVTSRGTHIVVPSSYCSKSHGLLDARSSDGRVLFILPWENSCLIGTTDVECDPSWVSSPSKDEVKWMIDEANLFLSEDAKIEFKDIMSVWSGIRPMVRDPQSKKDTQEIARNHVITLTESGLLLINGGKWTTYREMAEDTIDRAVEVFDLSDKSQKCVSHRTCIIGSHSWFKSFDILLTKFGIPSDVASHLSSYYGDRAWLILDMMEPESPGKLKIKRIHPNHPYLEEEVINAVKHEYAVKPSDVVCRRTRFAFIDMHAAYNSLDRITKIMAKELGWSQSQADRELANAKKELEEMGYSLLVSNEAK